MNDSHNTGVEDSNQLSLLFYEDGKTISPHLVEDSSQVSETTDFTTEDQQRLDVCEKLIKKGHSTFVKVGKALYEIKSKKLFRKEFPSFEAYCEKKWNITRVHANRLIKATICIENAKSEPSGSVPVINHESVIRDIISLPKEQQMEILRKAKELVGDGQATATTVRKAKAEVVRGKSDPTKSKRQSEAKQDDQIVLVPKPNMTLSELFEAVSWARQSVLNTAAKEEIIKTLDEALAIIEDFLQQVASPDPIMTAETTSQS